MKHLDLFSGIGGFALATEMVWDNVEHIFCDNEPFSQAIIRKHWPNSQIYGDIRTLTNTDNTGLQKERPEQQATGAYRTSSLQQTDLLTGGFPCQPFSQAGKRKGKADDRYLWPEMLRVIKEFRPRWIIGENVAGLLSMVEQQSDADVESEADTENDNNRDTDAGGIIWDIINDIEQAGYSVQTFVIPACSINAPHRRDRIWIVAHSESYGSGGRPTEVCKENGRQVSKMHPESNDTDSPDATNPKGFNGERWNRRPGKEQFRRSDWKQDWIEVATKLCGVDDGLPAELDGLKLSKSQHRTARLKGLGNAIVPQVAAEIMKVIKETEQ